MDSTSSQEQSLGLQGPMNIAQDIHICGICKHQFTDIEVFLAHKRSCTPPTVRVSVESLLQQVPTIATTPGSLPQNFTITNNLPPVSTETLSTVGSTVPTVYLTTTNGTNHTTGNVVSSAKTPSRTKPAAEKKFKCQYEGCSFTTAYNKDLDRHVRSHTGCKPFSCSICQKAFNRRDKLKQHLRIHSGEKPYACSRCSYAAADSSSLKKHVRTHTNERPFKCQICPYASRNSSQLIVHLRSHTGDCPFHCQLCEAKFKIKSDLKRHMRTHTGDKPYKCDLCDYRCAMKGNLKVHVRNNHGPCTLSCPQCPQTFQNKAQLRVHLKTHQEVSEKTTSKDHPRERLFKCQYCSFESRHPANVRNHTKKHHGDSTRHSQNKGQGKNNTESNNVKQVKTRQGSANLLRWGSKKPFSCSICKESFVREDSLRSHMNQHKEVQDTLQTTALAVLKLQETPSSELLRAWVRNFDSRGLSFVASSGSGRLSVPENEPAVTVQPANTVTILTPDGAAEIVYPVMTTYLEQDSPLITLDKRTIGISNEHLPPRIESSQLLQAPLAGPGMENTYQLIQVEAIPVTKESESAPRTSHSSLPLSSSSGQATVERLQLPGPVSDPDFVQTSTRTFVTRTGFLPPPHGQSFITTPSTSESLPVCTTVHDQGAPNVMTIGQQFTESLGGQPRSSGHSVMYTPALSSVITAPVFTHVPSFQSHINPEHSRTGRFVESGQSRPQHTDLDIFHSGLVSGQLHPENSAATHFTNITLSQEYLPQIIPAQSLPLHNNSNTTNCSPSRGGTSILNLSVMREGRFAEDQDQSGHLQRLGRVVEGDVHGQAEVSADRLQGQTNDNSFVVITSSQARQGSHTLG
ncbi:nucleic acid-templated transcription [Branchiostoma belcheri]|nr:nucleic acid-templated transcription [Branchiostoma belcheri]